MDLSTEETIQTLEEAYASMEREEFTRARELFESLFDGQDHYVAASLGYIHRREGTAEYDLKRAEKYYLIAASGGLPNAHHGLGIIYYEQGNLAKAMHHFSEASEAGIKECSWALYQLHKREGNILISREFLDTAAEQGHPMAVQRRAIDDILLRNGIRKLPRGLYRYFTNGANLFRYIKANAHRWG